MEPNPKQIVVIGYDVCGPRYSAARTRDPGPELQRLLAVLPAAATVLDIGCGGGFPVTAALSRHASVTGVDISPVQIEEARKRLPTVRFIAGDIMSQAFEPSSRKTCARCSKNTGSFRNAVSSSPKQPAHTTAGIGTPQVRWREMHQSGRVSIIW